MSNKALTQANRSNLMIKVLRRPTFWEKRIIHGRVLNTVIQELAAHPETPAFNVCEPFTGRHLAYAGVQLVMELSHIIPSSHTFPLNADSAREQALYNYANFILE